LFIVAVSSGAPSINQFLLTGFGLLFVTLVLPGGLASIAPMVKRQLSRIEWRDPEVRDSVGDGATPPGR
jgi:hypothetical protein